MENHGTAAPYGSPVGAIRIEQETRSVVIRRHDAVIAATNNAPLVHGMSETPVYYVPRQDVYTEHLIELGTKRGPGGGDAMFWSVTASGGGLEGAVWMLVGPTGETAPLADHIGFDPNPFNISVD